jgi:hypothetical protein
LQYFINLQPAKKPMLGRSIERPMILSLSVSEKSPKQKQVSNTYACVRQMALCCTNLPECATPSRQARKDRGLQIWIEMATAMPINFAFRQILNE